jgi:hypothetical protein
LAMTVWAEHPEVLEPVVVRDSVGVVKLDGERLPPPLGESTPIAPILDYTSREQALLDVRPTLGFFEDALDRFLPRPRLEVPPANSLSPRLGAEAKPAAALHIGVPLVIVRLHLGPAILEVPRSRPRPVFVLRAADETTFTSRPRERPSQDSKTRANRRLRSARIIDSLDLNPVMLSSFHRTYVRDNSTSSLGVQATKNVHPADKHPEISGTVTRTVQSAPPTDGEGLPSLARSKLEVVCRQSSWSVVRGHGSGR